MGLFVVFFAYIGVHAYLDLPTDASEEQKQMLFDMIVAGATGSIGGIIYATRIPERWMPGTFDLVFNSHQIWHVAAILCAYFFYHAIMGYVRWRLSMDCQLPTSPSSTPP